MHLANPESITISAVVPGGLGYANEAIIFNKESTYEIALSTEVRAAGGGAPVGSFIGAFAAGSCWRWWGSPGVAGLGIWTHRKLSLRNCATLLPSDIRPPQSPAVLMDRSSSTTSTVCWTTRPQGATGEQRCPFIDRKGQQGARLTAFVAAPCSALRKNDFPFKVGARARGTGMDSATHDDGGNDVAIANAGSRFYGEIDEAMVFNVGVDAAGAAGAWLCFACALSFLLLPSDLVRGVPRSTAIYNLF